MFCYNCGEENLDEAKYCRNCGAPLRKEEVVKKVEIVEAPIYQKNTSQQQTTTNSNNNGGSDWLTCCLCLVGIFIVFAILGLL